MSGKQETHFEVSPQKLIKQFRQILSEAMKKRRLMNDLTSGGNKEEVQPVCG